MDEKQKQVNQIAKKLGRTLIDNGIKILKSAFNFSTENIGRTELLNFLISQGLADKNQISLSDEKYYYTDVETIKAIIEQEWISEKQYMSDYFDCDNYAFNFSSYMSYVFDLNTAGVCYGPIYNKDTRALIGYHAFNLIAVSENKQLSLYLYEPMKEKYVRWNKNGDNIIDNWNYKINWVIFY